MQHLQQLGSGAVLVSGNELKMAIKAGEYRIRFTMGLQSWAMALFGWMGGRIGQESGGEGSGGGMRGGGEGKEWPCGELEWCSSAGHWRSGGSSCT